jgi:hypothetical protein
MPLTPAHPLAVLPLQRLGLPLSALVSGAVAPDVPVYLPVGVGYATTHSGRGIAADTLIGLVLLWLWSAVLRDAVVDLTPALRSRAPGRVRPDRRMWLLAPLAVAAGAATHVLWDSATHDWGFIVRELPLLTEQLGPFRLYGWLQHGSTVVGASAVAAYGVLRLRSRPATPRPPAVRRTMLLLSPVPVAMVTTGIVLRDPERAVGAGFLALLAISVAWRVARERKRRSTERRT